MTPFNTFKLSAASRAMSLVCVEHRHIQGQWRVRARVESVKVRSIYGLKSVSFDIGPPVTAKVVSFHETYSRAMNRIDATCRGKEMNCPKLFFHHRCRHSMNDELRNFQQSE